MTNLIKDPQTGRTIAASKKVLGEENLEYDYLEINKSPFTPGRLDLLSFFIYGDYGLFKYLINKNFYRDPFEILEQEYSTSNEGKKLIKVVKKNAVPRSAEDSSKTHPLDKTNVYG